MFEVYKKEITWGGKLLTFETGKIARQADAAIMVTYGGTTSTMVGKGVHLDTLMVPQVV